MQAVIPNKVDFSSCAVPSVVEGFRREARPKIVLAGIESHVCVLHTALDLLGLNFRVYVAADAVGSRYPVDHQTAIAHRFSGDVVPAAPYREKEVMLARKLYCSDHIRRSGAAGDYGGSVVDERVPDRSGRCRHYRD